jgi:hypothetical protein
VNVYLVIRTQPSFAIMKAFKLRADADDYIAKHGGGMLVEEWNVT